MKKVLSILSFIFVYYANANACDCGTPPSLDSAIKVDYIFSGLLVSSELKTIIFENGKFKIFDSSDNSASGDPDARFFYKYKFKILTKYKGLKKRKIVYVISLANPLLCGFQFIKGNQYIIFGSKSQIVKNGYKKYYGIHTDKCSRTSRFTQKEEDEIKKMLR